MILNKNFRRVMMWLFVTIIVVSGIELFHAFTANGDLRWTYAITLLLGIGGLINIFRQNRKAGEK